MKMKRVGLLLSCVGAFVVGMFIALFVPWSALTGDRCALGHYVLAASSGPPILCAATGFLMSRFFFRQCPKWWHFVLYALILAPTIYVVHLVLIPIVFNPLVPSAVCLGITLLTYEKLVLGSRNGNKTEVPNKPFERRP